MNYIKRMGTDFFALDIGTSSIRIVQLAPAGQGSWNLLHYNYVPVEPKLLSSDSAEARAKLREIIQTAVGQSGVRTRDVVIGLASNKTFITVADVPMVSPEELRATMKYQVEQYIPTSVDDSKVDWALLGPSLRGQNQQEVLLASTSNSYSEDQLEFVESMGFNVIGAEPDAIAMVRALADPNIKDTRVILNIGDMSTDLAITYGDMPRLVRLIPTGINSLVRSVVQNLNVQEDQARQFILKFGLDETKLEGRVRQALDGVLVDFSNEVIRSIKFFQTRYPEVPIGGMLIAGLGGGVPQLDNYLSMRTGVPVQPVNPWQRVRVTEADSQQLALVASEFVVAVGLAQRRNDT